MDTATVTTVVFGSGLGVVITMMGWAFKRVFTDMVSTNKKTQDVLEQHLRECAEIPKSTILEKIEGLCEKQDIYQESNKAAFKRIDEELIKQRDRYDTTVTLFSQQQLGQTQRGPRV